MRIACPECDTRYEIAPVKGRRRGRRIRCAVCGHGWRVFREAEAPSAETLAHDGIVPAPDGPPAAAPGPAVQTNVPPEISIAARSTRLRAPNYDELYGRPEAKPPARPPFRFPIRAPSRGFSLTAGCLLALSLLIAQRERIVRQIGPANVVYAALGLPVNERGLEIRHLQSKLIEEGSQRVLAVEGEIANVRHGPVAVPDMRVSVHVPGGREVYAWQTMPPRSNLKSGETVQFRARLVAPPEEGREIKVRFASTGVRAGKPAPK